MKKIISLFQRNYDGDRLVRDEVVPGAEWVIAREGTATRKWDGTCCMVRSGRLFKRHDCKHGKPQPEHWEPCEEKPDPNTGHWPGWLPVGDGPQDAAYREAFHRTEADGTYELCGPKVQGNPENFPEHILIRHGAHLVCAPRTFAELRAWFAGPGRDIEGVVWHHPDGRMVKIKAKDFGLKRQAS